MQRPRQPVRVKAIQKSSRMKYSKFIEPKAILRLTEYEEDLEEKPDFDDRPPCRQNANVFDLEDNFHPVCSN